MIAAEQLSLIELPKPERGRTFRLFLEHRTVYEQLAPFKPNGMRYERVVYDVLAAARANPDIPKCDARSIIRALQVALPWDLTVGSTCWLIPTEDDRGKPVLGAMQGYLGQIVLCKRHRLARSVSADAVFAGEHFLHQQGSRCFVEHQRHWERGDKLVGAWAWAQITNATGQLALISATEVDAIRAEYSEKWSPDVAGELSGIPWYATSKAVRRLMKLMAIEANLAHVFADDFADKLDSSAPEKAAVPAADDTPMPGFVEPGSEIERQFLGAGAHR